MWNDSARAAALFAEKTELEKRLSVASDAERELADLKELAALASESELADLEKSARALLSSLEKVKLELMLSGEADSAAAYLEIHAGAGGTEAQDWAAMLLRMYSRWADARGFPLALLDRHDDDEAGIKSATVRIDGRSAYGWLKHESGIHRLVRISPFDAAARRHTSFASVWVYPVVDDRIEIEINPADLRIDTYRASGAGGQKVNKTDSAVRITHLPTGIVAASQTERSQHQNRETAMKMLRSRLYEAELSRRETAKKSSYESKSEIGWGAQIRSYVLQPYQMVKDLRSGYETSNVAAVLDGGLDGFLEAMLAAPAAEK